MAHHSRFIVCLLAVVFVGRRAPAQTPPDKDFQQWTNVAATWQVKPRLAITGFGEVHFGNDVSQFDQELVSAGVAYSPKKWLTIGTGYLYLHANAALSGLNHENRIYAEATFKAPAFHHFLVSDRVRPELRWEQTPVGPIFTQRYRNRVILERPIRKYSPFVMWEKFYNVDVKAWNRTRYYAGFTMPVSERASTQFYFLRQNDELFRPFHKSAIGASLIFDFGKLESSARPKHSMNNSE